MSSKPIAWAKLKYLFSVGILMTMFPASAFAQGSSGSITITLQVVARCNLPIENQSLDLPIQCSARAIPSAVNIATASSEFPDYSQNQPSIMMIDF